MAEPLGPLRARQAWEEPAGRGKPEWLEGRFGGSRGGSGGDGGGV